jgi:hypothetical protein
MFYLKTFDNKNLILDSSKIMAYVYNPDKTMTFYIQNIYKYKNIPILVKSAKRDISFLRRRLPAGYFFNRKLKKSFILDLLED